MCHRREDSLETSGMTFRSSGSWKSMRVDFVPSAGSSDELRTNALSRANEARVLTHSENVGT